MKLPYRTQASPRLVLLSSFGATSFINYAFSLAMGWLLIPGDFGVLAFAQTVLLIVGVLLQSGIPWALAREIANDHGQRRAALIRGALVANVSIAAVVGIGVLALYALGPLRPGLETQTVALSVTASLPFIAVVTVAFASAQGVEKFSTMAALQVTEVVTKALAGTVLVLTGFGVGGAVFGFLVGSVLAAAIGGVVLFHGFEVRWKRTYSLPDYRSAVSIFAALLGIVLLLNLHLLAVKLVAPGERALTGFYQVAIILANTPYYLVAAVVLPVLFVQLSRYETASMTGEHTGRALRLVALFIIPIEIALVLVPRLPVETLFPDVYLPAATYLRILAVGSTLVIVTSILSVTFQAIGRAVVPACVLLVSAGIEVAALWIIVPRVAAWSAAAIFVVFAAANLVVLSGLYLRALPDEDVHKAAHWTARYTIALISGATVTIVLYAVTDHMLPGLVIGGASYILIVLLLRLASTPALPESFISPLRRVRASRS